MISGGASQGLTVTPQMLSDPIATKAVWMTARCFFATRKVFEDGDLTGNLRGVNKVDDANRVRGGLNPIRRCWPQVSREGVYPIVVLHIATSTPASDSSILTNQEGAGPNERLVV